MWVIMTSDHGKTFAASGLQNRREMTRYLDLFAIPCTSKIKHTLRNKIHNNFESLPSYTLAIISTNAGFSTSTIVYM